MENTGADSRAYTPHCSAWSSRKNLAEPYTPSCPPGPGGSCVAKFWVCNIWLFFFFYRRSLAGQGNFSKLSLLGGCEVPSPGLILAVETQVGTMGFQGFVGCNAPCSETWECHSLEVVVVMVLGGSS